MVGSSHMHIMSCNLPLGSFTPFYNFEVSSEFARLDPGPPPPPPLKSAAGCLKTRTGGSPKPPSPRIISELYDVATRHETSRKPPSHRLTLAVQAVLLVVHRLGQAIAAGLVRPREEELFGLDPVVHPTRTIPCFVPPSKTIDRSEPRSGSSIPGRGRFRASGCVFLECLSGWFVVYWVVAAIWAVAVGAASALARNSKPPTCVCSEKPGDVEVRINANGRDDHIITTLGPSITDLDKIVEVFVRHGSDPLFDKIVLAYPSAFLGLLVLVPADLYDGLVFGKVRSISQRTIVPTCAPLELVDEWFPDQVAEEDSKVGPEPSRGPVRQWDAAAARAAQLADYEAIDAGVAVLRRRENTKRRINKSSVAARVATRVAEVQTLRAEGKRTRRMIQEEREDWLEMKEALEAKANGVVRVYRTRVEEPEEIKLCRAWLKTPAGQLYLWSKAN
ncbi:hypothetical protein CTheo_5277 [Ceratobasidium theobromae]|uniref:Transmembrane protein n=1 Tax=Ceratobasidium theobromae TaxID=1582974 RepID=A0A5N5QHY8_9AGAM|nr:hypothetical protein CTheo_5277 [Ceratobasidium theobromae]